MNLLRSGYEEIIIIAQDTTKYGIDLYGKSKLTELLNKISKIDGIRWVRFLYAYPESITDELIKEVKNNPKICKYFDIPIQHISNDILKKMNRKSNRESIIQLVKKIKIQIPNVIFRTSLIVGFPTETEEDFNELCDFLLENKLDKVGVFKYSKEDGTRAAMMQGQIPDSLKNKRFNKIMKLQKEISIQKMKEKIGREYEILIESQTEDKKFYIGRSYMDVPDMDGVILLKSKESLKNGMFVKCKIIDTSGEYDLIGEYVI